MSRGQGRAYQRLGGGSVRDHGRVRKRPGEGSSDSMHGLAIRETVYRPEKIIKEERIETKGKVGQRPVLVRRTKECRSEASTRT